LKKGGYSKPKKKEKVPRTSHKGSRKISRQGGGIGWKLKGNRTELRGGSPNRSYERGGAKKVKKRSKKETIEIEKKKERTGKRGRRATQPGKLDP